MRRRRILFRRSPFLVCYWSDKRLVFENYATGTRVGADPLTCTVLDFFHGWRSWDGLIRHLHQFTPASLRHAVNALAKHSLLERTDRAPSVRELAMRAWAPWNPAAGFYHFSTKDVAYTPGEQATNPLGRPPHQAKPAPPCVKRYSRARSFSLPAPASEGEFPRVLLARRTWRRFSRKPLDLPALGTLLGLTWGVHRWLRVPGLGRVAFKTSPSGGARHPIEVYLLALRVAELPRGLYHYAADTHRLELLRRGTPARPMLRYLPTQWWYGSAAALMLMTAVFPRAWWRYPFPRAYRAALMEAGHLCQTFCLVATWLGLAPFCSLALADSRIEKDLGVDGVTESVLYAAGVGTRPSGVDWAPWPRRRRTS